MLDAAARRLIDPPLHRAARVLAGLGVDANTVTLLGFCAGIASFPALIWQQDIMALACIVLNRLADGLDGAIARIRGATDLGGFLDIVLDFIVYAGVPVAFAIGRPEHALVAAVLVFSFVGTMASFLAFAIIAAKRGLTTSRRGAKSIYYLGGIAEGSETILFLALICLFPDAFAWFAGIFAVACWLTTAGRVAAAVNTFAR
jgi:phosphatidylglycerophosphate synthase